MYCSPMQYNFVEKVLKHTHIYFYLFFLKPVVVKALCFDYNSEPSPVPLLVPDPVALAVAAAVAMSSPPRGRGATSLTSIDMADAAASLSSLLIEDKEARR